MLLTLHSIVGKAPPMVCTCTARHVITSSNAFSLSEIYVGIVQSTSRKGVAYNNTRIRDELQPFTLRTPTP